MPEAIVAATQYGDFKGTVSIDGYERGSLLQALWMRAKDRKGFLPVGAEFFAGEPGKDRPFDYVKIFGVDENLVGGGSLANFKGEIPVSRFELELSFAEMLQLIKRFHIVVRDGLCEARLVAVPDN